MSEISPESQPTDLEKAALATVVYEPGQTIDGWKRVQSFDDPDSGFKAAVFQREGSDEYVLAFAGTDMDSARDWRTNIGQAFGRNTRQYDLAAKTAREFQDQYGGNGAKLSLTGHSLGGGLTTVGTAVTGLPAVTFNPAGVHDNTLEGYKVNPEKFREKASAGLIRSYVVEGEILDLVNGFAPGKIFSPATKVAIAKAEEIASGTINTVAGAAQTTVETAAEKAASSVSRHVPRGLRSVMAPIINGVAKGAADTVNGVVGKVADGAEKMVNGALNGLSSAADRVLGTPLTPTAYGARINIKDPSATGIFKALNKHKMGSVKQGMQDPDLFPAPLAAQTSTDPRQRQKAMALAFKQDPAQAARAYPELAGAQQALEAVSAVAGQGRARDRAVGIIHRKLVQQIDQGKVIPTPNQAIRFVKNVINQGVSLGH